PPFVECRALRVDYTYPSGVLLQPRIASDGGTRAAGAGPDDHPARYRKRLLAQLPKHRFGNVVIAAPVGGPRGVGELVGVMAAAAGCEISRPLIDGCRILDQVAAPAIELDQFDLLLYGRGRHHSHERQVEQPRKVNLPDCRRPGRCLNEGGASVDQVVAQPVEHQRPRQSMLETSGGM